MFVYMCRSPITVSRNSVCNSLKFEESDAGTTSACVEVTIREGAPTMKNSKPDNKLNVNLKRVRRSVRTDVNTGATNTISFCWTSGGGPRKVFDAPAL